MNEEKRMILTMEPKKFAIVAGVCLVAILAVAIVLLRAVDSGTPLQVKYNGVDGFEFSISGRKAE